MTNGRVPGLGDIITALIEDFLDVRHPEWTAGEGSFVCVTLHSHRLPRFTGSLTYRVIATRAARL